MLVNPLFRIHSLIACQVPANLLSLPSLIPCLESTVSLHFTVYHAILLLMAPGRYPHSCEAYWMPVNAPEVDFQVLPRLIYVLYTLLTWSNVLCRAHLDY